jgi:hypothetical protein
MAAVAKFMATQPDVSFCAWQVGRPPMRFARPSLEG